MTRDETRGEIDLSLPIEGFEQIDTDVLRTGGQVIERLAAIAGNAGWRYIEIASKGRTPSLHAGRHAPRRCGHPGRGAPTSTPPRAATIWPTTVGRTAFCLPADQVEALEGAC